MKIALICDSLLLDRSLEMYLKEYLTSYKLCDFVVATQPTESQKPVFLIGDFENAQLRIPFTRELLLDALESFYQQLQGKGAIKNTPQESSQEIKQAKSFADYAHSSPKQTKTNSTLEAKIEEILHRYAKEIQETIEEHLKNQNG